MTQQEMLQKFTFIQSEIATLIRDLPRVSVYAEQSAAFRDLKKWAAKSERVKQGLTEMRL